MHTSNRRRRDVVVVGARVAGAATVMSLARGRIDGVGMVLVLGAVGLVCTALTEAPRCPASRTWPVLAAGLVLGAWFVAHIRRHPDPLVAPRLFSVRAIRAGAAGIAAYCTGFAAMLLGMTLLLTAQWHFRSCWPPRAPRPVPSRQGSFHCSMADSRPRSERGPRLWRARCSLPRPGPGRWTARGTAPAYAAVVLPAMLLWGVANALIQPSLFASADAHAASGAGGSVGGAGRGASAGFCVGRGDLRRRARGRRERPGRVRPRLGRCRDHRHHRRRRARQRRPAGQGPRGGSRVRGRR